MKFVDKIQTIIGGAKKRKPFKKQWPPLGIPGMNEIKIVEIVEVKITDSTPLKSLKKITILPTGRIIKEGEEWK